MAIGVHELASMSERRVERLVNPGKNGDDIFESWHFVHVCRME